MIGNTGGRPRPPAVNTTVDPPGTRWIVARTPERTGDPGEGLAHLHLVDLELLVPTPWTTRQIVPASASQSASVSGISSPSGPRQQPHELARPERLRR